MKTARGVLRSRLLRETGIYAISGGLKSAIPFLLLPILTLYLEPAEYGVLDMFRATVLFTVPFMGLSVQAAVGRQYVELEARDLSVYVGNSLALVAIASLAVAVVLFAAASDVSRLSAIPVSWLVGAYCIALSQAVGMVLLTLWQMSNQPLKYGIYRIIQSAGEVGLTLFMVIVLGLGWRGQAGAQWIVAALALVVAFVLLRREGFLRLEARSDYRRHALAYSLPLIPHSVAGVVIGLSDRFFITNMAGIESTGLYAVGYQIGLALALVTTAFNQAWVPWLYRRLRSGRESDRVEVARVTLLYSGGILVLATVIGLGGGFVVERLLPSAYAGAGAFVIWVAFGYAFDGLYKLAANQLFYLERTGILAWITGFAAVANIGLNYVLIRSSGPIGAAQATAASFLITFVLTSVVAYRLQPLPYWSAIIRTS